MTSREITERYLSDVRALHEAQDAGIIDAFEHDSRIVKLDDKLFEDMGFLTIEELTPENAIYDAEIGELVRK